MILKGMNIDYTGFTQYWYTVRRNVDWVELRWIQLCLSPAGTEYESSHQLAMFVRSAEPAMSLIQKYKGWLSHTDLFEILKWKRRLKPFAVQERLYWIGITLFPTVLPNEQQNFHVGWKFF